MYGPSLIRRVGSGEDCVDEDSYRLYACPFDGTELKLPVRFRCEDYKACPNCSMRWAYLEGRRASWRMSHVGALLKRRRRWRRDWAPRHMTLSLRQWQLRRPMTLSGVFRAAWAVMKKIGVYAGLMMYHPERHGARRCSEEVTWNLGPHVHFVGWGPLKREPLAAARKAGWFVMDIRDVEHGEDMYKLVGYLGSHAGYEPRKHSVRWFGWASYNKCRGVPALPRATAEDLRPACPVCDRLMLLVIEVDWTGRQGMDVPLTLGGRTQW